MASAVLGVIVTLLVLYAIFLFFWWYGRYLDDLDHKSRVDEQLAIYGEVASAPARRSAEEVRAELLAQAAASRKDAALRNVIISEKRDKKAAAFTTSGVPFPFKSREQFERSVRAPIGLEWNPATSHADMIKAKVSTVKGAIIDPLADHNKRRPGDEPKGKKGGRTKKQ